MMSEGLGCQVLTGLQVKVSIAKCLKSHLQKMLKVNEGHVYIIRGCIFSNYMAGAFFLNP